MRPTVVLVLDLALVLAFSARPSDAEGGSSAAAHLKSGLGPPPANAPSDIWDAWLHFHEADLCQGLDTVFVFHKNGMEIWCRIEDEKIYQKFSDLIAPLRTAHEVDVYATRPAAEKKQAEEKNPPPSLWNNSELRAYLQDPFLRGDRGGDSEAPRRPDFIGSHPDFMFKQRMILFADQMLDWERKMNRCAGDLPALAGVASGSALPKEICLRAAAICREHSQAVDRYAEKLGENLTQALPKGTKKSPSASEREKPEPAVSTAKDEAYLIADSAQNVARRIYRFIHPTHYTVGLTDLREPSLLESLKSLRKQVSAFQRALSK